MTTTTLSRADALLALRAIDTARTLMVVEANRLTRKRSMSSNDLHQHSQLSAALGNLLPLVEALGTEHNLGGF